MKWVFVAGGVALVGFAVWQWLSESVRAARAADRPRQPWEMV
jgi:hypothetical protein